MTNSCACKSKILEIAKKKKEKQERSPKRDLLIVLLMMIISKVLSRGLIFPNQAKRRLRKGSVAKPIGVSVTMTTLLLLLT